MLHMAAVPTHKAGHEERVDLLLTDGAIEILIATTQIHKIRHIRQIRQIMVLSKTLQDFAHQTRMNEMTQMVKQRCVSMHCLNDGIERGIWWEEVALRRT